MRSRSVSEMASPQPRELLRFAFDLIPDPILVLDDGHAIVERNEAARKLLGDAAGPLLEFFSPLKAPLESIDTSGELIRNGRVFEYHAAPGFASGLHLLVLRDVTTRAAPGLEAGEEVEAARDELKQMAYTTSHDLKEPLRIISSYAQLLTKRYRGRLDADADEFLGYIHSGVERAGRLINDLVLYSRVLNRQQEPFTRVDLNNVVQWAVMNLQARVSETGAAITYDPLPSLSGDQMQLIQLMQGLLDNALKFVGAEPPRVHVSAELEGDMWRFAVRDNGPGIDPKYQERIFGAFKRLVGREVPGSGLGLAIARRVVEKHGGRIWVASEPGRGSIFYFTLPSE
ncbi:MAG: PAS domain-containing protein [Acidobacteria bacterium]|nr:PAS domain-containing protein [Acidobacteriota bacterium]